MRFRHHVSVLLFAAFGSLASSESYAGFIHQGANDPTTEGWSIGRFDGSTLTGLGFGPGVSVGPVSDMGVDAWFVNDESTADKSNGVYASFLTASKLAEAQTQGFSLSTRLKVVNSPDSFDGSVFVAFFTGTTRWHLAFGSQADGDPTVQLVSDEVANPTYTLAGTGGGYHTYSLVFDPTTSTADLFVDGIERISNYGGRTLEDSSAAVVFGSGRNTDTGHGRYASVEFSTVSAIPEPSSLTILAIGLVVLFAYRSYRCRRCMCQNS